MYNLAASTTSVSRQSAVNKRIRATCTKQKWMNLKHRKARRRGDSTISHVVAELAGMVYSLGMSLVMARIDTGTTLRCALRRGFREAYRQLSVPRGKRRVIAGRVILGKFAAVWLAIPNWVSGWPHIALTIGNSKGSVVSAILADSSSLEEATTKFVVSTNVADLMVAEKLTVLSIACRKRTIESCTCHEVNGRRRETEPHDACQRDDLPDHASRDYTSSYNQYPQQGTGNGGPWLDQLQGRMQRLTMSISFMVMSKSHSHIAREGCPLNPVVNWLDERDFLKRERGGEFSCASPKRREKLVIPAHVEGLE